MPAASGKGPCPTRRKTRPPMHAAFRHHYGLHPAPYPNDGLPMGLRRGIGPGGVKTGLQIDCMLCHGGSIGGQSYVGLGNTQLDLKAVLFELTIADGKRAAASRRSSSIRPAAPITPARSPPRSSACEIAISASARFRCHLAVNLPEMDTPPWWHLKRKRTMYYDGRTDVRSVRTNMQFMLGEKSFADLQALEPVVSRRAGLPPQHRAAQVSLSRSTPKRPNAGGRFRSQLCDCATEHMGPTVSYPNKIIPLEKIGTDPARSHGPLRPAGRPLQLDLARCRVSRRDQASRVSGPAAGRHLGVGSLPAQRLGADAARRARLLHPPCPLYPTAFDRLFQLRHFRRWLEVQRSDRRKNWPSTAKRSPFQAKFIVDTARFGMGNQGHTFGDALSETERMDAIEYLKGL